MSNARVREHVAMTCQECSTVVMMPNWKAKKTKFCSMSCRDKRRAKNSNNPAKIKNCKGCSKKFKAKFKSKEGKYRDYCSVYCMKESKRETLTCQSCGCEFRRHKSETERRSPKSVYCSKACRYNGMTGDNALGYVRGYYINDKGHKFIYKGGDRIAEHRLVASQYIGRDLRYDDEPILHINGINDDNRPENLYVCSDWCEMSTILMSYDAPYPVKSNLEELKVNNTN